MEQIYFQPLPDAKPEFHVDDIPGEETETSHHRMRFQAKDGTGQLVEVTLELTVPHLVEIAKHLFWGPAIRKFWFANALQRLLVKRWALYTSDRTKDQEPQYRARCTELDFEWINGRPVMKNQ